MSGAAHAILTAKTAVLYHIFYEDTVNTIADDLHDLNVYKPFYLFNICVDTPGAADIRQRLATSFPGCYITCSSNKGKDIGAKLLLLGLLMQNGIEAEWLVLLHDKKSLQAVNARTWKSELFSIIGRAKLAAVGKHTEDPTTGIIAHSSYVRKEPAENGILTGGNGPLLSSLLAGYDIKPPTLEFIAGSMFWVRASALLAFFRQHDPLQIRASLEENNVIDNFGGTVTHSWERMLSWVVTSGQFKIKTV